MCLPSCSGVGVLSPISASGSCEYITSAEHVEVFVTISHKYRGDLEITLISPSGVESILAYPHLEGSQTTPRAENYVEWRVSVFTFEFFSMGLPDCGDSCFCSSQHCETGENRKARLAEYGNFVLQMHR
jgi:hypothetical protein